MTAIPAPGLAFVRKIATQENYAGSAILIPEQARDKTAASQWEIVACGAPEPCDDEDCERKHTFLDDAQRVALLYPRHPDAETPYLRDERPDLTFRHLCDIKPGDWVLCRKRSPSVTPDPDLFVIRQADVLGRFVERG